MNSSIIPGSKNIGNSVGNVVGGILSKVTMTHVVIAFVVGVVCIVGMYYFYLYVAKKFKIQYQENQERYPSSTDSNKEAELILFTVDWCPHCKQAKPEWEQIKTKYADSVINGYTILFTEVNCTNETPEIDKMMDKYKIEGYPTIKMIKDGQVIEFDAKPTQSSLDQFIQTVIV
jgi:thiol-disulfide isomerase/thioredoxin